MDAKDAEMVTPFQLHRRLDRAQALDAEGRINVLKQILGTGILAVIRRIPQTMSPFSDEEKEMVFQWANNQAKSADVSGRDFAFHLMAGCNVPAERVLAILKENRTFSRSALEHIQTIFGANDPIQQLNEYLFGVAEELLINVEVRPRDRGRHMLMTLASTDSDWQCLALRFSTNEISDLRQRVIERFLQECPDVVALRTFADNVVRMCLEKIETADLESVHGEASHMHWVFICLERIEATDRISSVAYLFANKFGTALPWSVRRRVDQFISTIPHMTQRIARVPLMATKAAVRYWGKPVLPPIVWQPRPILGPVPFISDHFPCSSSGKHVRSQVHPLPVIVHRPVDPSSVEGALREGWTVRKENGRQVILVKDGRAITRYRPK